MSRVARAKPSTPAHPQSPPTRRCCRRCTRPALRRVFDRAGYRLQPPVIVARAVFHRRAVQAVIDQAGPTARLLRSRRRRRIRRDSRHVMIREQGVGLRRRTRSRGAARRRRRASHRLRSPARKSGGAAASKARLGGSWTSRMRSLSPERPHLGQRLVEQRLAIDEAAFVGDLLRQLGREGEMRGDRVRPAHPGQFAMGAVEGRIDLGAGEGRGVALEPAPVRRESVRDDPGNRPACRADAPFHHGCRTNRPYSGSLTR